MSKSFLSINIPGLEQEIARINGVMAYIPEQCQLAAARAINRTLEGVRTDALRVAKNAYTAKVSGLRKRMRIKKASRTKLQGLLTARDRNGAGLIDFAPSPAKRPDWKGVAPKERRPAAGISSKIKRTGARKVYAREGGSKPFIARVDNGSHVFVRMKNGALERLFGPSPLAAISRDDNAQILREEAKKKFSDRLQHEVDLLLGGTK